MRLCGIRSFLIGTFWDTGGDPAIGQRDAEPVGIIALIAEQYLGVRLGVDHQRRTFKVARLAIAEQHAQWPPLTILDCMQLGVLAVLGASKLSIEP